MWKNKPYLVYLTTFIEKKIYLCFFLFWSRDFFWFFVNHSVKICTEFDFIHISIICLFIGFHRRCCTLCSLIISIFYRNFCIKGIRNEANLHFDKLNDSTVIFPSSDSRALELYKKLFWLTIIPILTTPMLSHE